ncbi:endonuclease-reverse transcriptase domain-containing protein [Hirsutella rhossiliensis]|uniref:Endonuclease-reverse transcriptase domain-containing protein n=1 Tax=Hirsutella rhossiliensis TaxID=111463 RepID=A0A9P8N0Q8_9HYPO|nr:endonuclease-reverse transcriptase domain-containing protein [Hirsutella rhossiliensis]KAH0962622.1 endonuclease-reverse transcriptase domain-containing protein [Hirsutella rhossiliensis]
MHHRHPNNRSNRRALRVFQANVGKIPPAHDTALALADSERYDIILLQEPWTGLKDGRCLTKTHPAYDTFSPVTDWDGRDTRPRVMTYVRRSAGLVADQKRPPDYDAALEILLGWCATDKCLVSGDFNAKHPSWQAGRQEHRGEDIAFWAMDNRLSLLNAVDVPTNARGSTIDLAFSNIPLADASSPSTLPLCKIRLNSDEELKRFVELVEAGAAFIPTTTSTPPSWTTLRRRWWTFLVVQRELRADRPFADGDSVFRAVRWLIKILRAVPGTSQVDGRVYETQLEKATALRRATLERRTASDDIPDPWIPVNTDKMIPFPNQVSFEEARDATLRTGNTSPGSDNITCGLPQGSPVSPILFLLYTEPIYRLGHSQGRFGYADDTAILCVGNSLDETTAEASHHTEVMHFSRTKPKTAPPVLHGDSLSFKTHVEKWTAKAQAVAFHLRRLTNTKHGPLPSAMRRAVCACVIPVLLYAAEAWYPGPKSPRWTKPSKEGPSGIGNLVKKMSKALYTSLRAILPVWRTTPTNVLHRRREYRPFLYSSKGVGRPLLRALKLSTKLTRSSSARRDQKLPS